MKEFWGLCSCCVSPLLPLLPFMPPGSSCMGCVSCSDSRFLDARFLGDWYSAPSPSTSSPALPLGEGSSLAGLLHSLPCGVSESLSGPAGLLEVHRLALTELLGRAGGAWLLGLLPAAPSLVSLLPLWGHLPLLSLLSFLHPHHSGSGGSALQPHGKPNSLPLDRRALG